MRERRDFLPVCNDQGVPLVDFQAMFCIRCVQPECSRSRTGTLFETRTSTWEDRLFKNPDRMSKDDPLYPLISAKRFIEIDMGRVPEIGEGRSDWVDPRALEDVPSPVTKPRPARKPREIPEESIETESAPSNPRVEIRTQQPLGNSPFTQGAMLVDPRGAAALPPPPPKKPKDSWEAVPSVRTPLTKEDTPIVKRGARLRFGPAPGVGTGEGDPK